MYTAINKEYSVESSSKFNCNVFDKTWQLNFDDDATEF